MGKVLMEVKGGDGRIELMTDRVIIHRPGLINMLKYGFHARREIPLSSISSVNFRDASMFKMGEIDFDYAGRNQMDRAQNKVIFARKDQAAFYELKEKIFEMLEDYARHR